MKFLYPESINFFYMYQRPQQLMNAFSKEGHQAFFINKDLDAHGAQNPESVLKISKNLWVYPHKTNPRSLDFDVLYYTFPPPGMNIIRRKRPDFILFDSVDEPINGVFNFWNANGAYYKSLKRADLVLATSEILFKAAKEYNDEVILVPNACDFNHFTKETKRPASYGSRPIVLYCGAIATWVDLELIKASAVIYPEYDFYCIGASMNDILTPPFPENLYVLGHQEYEEVPSFVQHADVCIIPFNVEQPEVQATNPVKLWEYMATGNPIVTTAMPETKHKGVLWSKTKREFINNIEKAMNTDKNENFIQFAKENSWEARAKKILDKMEELK